MLPDDARSCTECGHLISRKLRDDLLQEQPAEETEVRTGRTAEASIYQIFLTVSVAVCGIGLMSLFFFWIPDTTGFALLVDDSLHGPGSDLLRFAPVTVSLASAVAGTVIVSGRYRFLIIPMGLTMTVMAFFFLIELRNHYSVDPSFGAYAAFAAGIIVCLLGLSRKV
ncbi:hypothetical protein TALC_01155 [Thermoplasmatales archaeon BRNA1]|nr:hypothetical protein TALC_01155 [Thermoplasmatales archaeon BRNA1]